MNPKENPYANYVQFVIILNNQQLGSSFELHGYENTLYLIKLLSTPGKALITSMFSEIEINPLDNPEMLIEAGFKSQVNTLIKWIQTGQFQERFHNQAFYQYLRDNIKSRDFLLSDGDEFIDIIHFCEQETQQSIHEVDWETILYAYFALTSGDQSRKSKQDWEELYSDFCYELPPLRPGDIVTFEQSAGTIIGIYPRNENQKDQIARGINKKPTISSIVLDRIPIQVTHSHTHAVTYLPTSPKIQQIYSVEALILWDEIDHPTKQVLLKQLGWNQLKEPYGLKIKTFHLQSQKFIAIKTSDGRNYFKPHELRIHDKHSGWTVIVRLTDQTTIHPIICTPKNAHERLLELGINIDDITKYEIPKLIYNISSHHQAIELHQRDIDEPTFDADYKALNGSYSSLLSFGFHNGRVVTIKQDKSVTSSIDPEKRELIYIIQLEFLYFNEYYHDLLVLEKNYLSPLFNKEPDIEDEITDIPTENKVFQDIWGSVINELDWDDDEDDKAY